MAGNATSADVLAALVRTQAEVDAMRKVLSRNTVLDIDEAIGEALWANIEAQAALQLAVRSRLPTASAGMPLADAVRAHWPKA